MPNVFIRNLPQHIYEKLKQHAECDHRSVPAENVYLLEQFFDREAAHKQHRKARESIIERAKQKQPLPTDSLTLLHENRDGFFHTWKK